MKWLRALQRPAAPGSAEARVESVATKNICFADLTARETPCLIGRMDKADKEAIEQVLAGDKDAYRVLVDSYYQFAFRIAFRITGDEADAEEVTQEAFLRAYTKLSTFRQDASFSTWVNRIAMNTAFTLIERRHRDVTRSAERSDGSGMAVEFTDTAARPDQVLLAGEAAAMRREALAALTPMERTAFTLRHMEEMGIPEIATALNVTANSAKQAVFRAVSKLRRSLAPFAAGGIR